MSDDPAVVNSREDIGRQRGSTQPQPRPSTISDAVVCGITRKLHGHFTPEQKDAVRRVLEAGVAIGYGFTWIDTEYADEVA